MKTLFVMLLHWAQINLLLAAVAFCWASVQMNAQKTAERIEQARKVKCRIAGEKLERGIVKASTSINALDALRYSGSYLRPLGATPCYRDGPVSASLHVESNDPAVAADELTRKV